MGEIYSLNYDYSHQNGHSIIFNEYGGKKLTSSDLNSVQLKMIQSNQMPHMLSMTVENIDLTTRLHYDLTSKRKVTSYFQDNSTTMNDYYQLFLSIITTLETSGSYMLDEQNFILQKEFIFIGENAGDVYLAYIPIKAMNKETSITEDIKNLLTNIAGEVEGLQGNEFKSILNYMKNSSFSLSGLKKLLLELISLRSSVNQTKGINTGNNFNDNYSVPTNIPVNNQHVNPHPVQAKENTTEIKSPKKQKGKKKLPALSSRAKVYLFTGSLLAIALIWKLYEMNTNQSMLILCTAISLLIVGGAFVFWKIWRPGTKPIEIEAPVPEVNNDVPQQPAQTATKQPVQNQNFQSPNQEQPVANNMQSFLTHKAMAATSMDTTLLTQNSDDTVLLEDEANLTLTSDSQQSDITAHLIRNVAEQQEETIEINDSNFLIGRNADSVNYAEDAMGVSRIHAEIIKIDTTSYGLKDLGSKNGSLLNGNTMVPYKIYALNENDEFDLGKANYTFKWSNS